MLHRIQHRKAVAWWFILLLVGQQSAQINAVRMATFAFEGFDAPFKPSDASSVDAKLNATSESSAPTYYTYHIGPWPVKYQAVANATAPIAITYDGPIPTSDDDCTMWGEWPKGKCGPVEFCRYVPSGKALFGIHRDQSCRLKIRFMPDERLAKKFVKHSIRVLKASEGFRASGSQHSLYKMKNSVATIGQCLSALGADSGALKTRSRALWFAFKDKPIADYAKILDVARNSIPDLESFDTSDFSDDALTAFAIDRVQDNFEEGLKQLPRLREILSIINLTQLQHVVTMAQEATKADFQQALPKLTGGDLDRLISFADEQRANDEQACKDTADPADCLHQKTSEDEENGIQAVLEVLEAVVDQETGLKAVDVKGMRCTMNRLEKLGIIKFVETPTCKVRLGEIVKNDILQWKSDANVDAVKATNTFLFGADCDANAYVSSPELSAASRAVLALLHDVLLKSASASLQKHKDLQQDKDNSDKHSIEGTSFAATKAHSKRFNVSYEANFKTRTLLPTPISEYHDDLDDFVEEKVDTSMIGPDESAAFVQRDVQFPGGGGIIPPTPPFIPPTPPFIPPTPPIIPPIPPTPPLIPPAPPFEFPSVPDIISDPVGEIGDILHGAGEAIGDLPVVGPIFEAVGDVVGGIWNTLADTLGGISSFLSPLFNPFGDIMGFLSTLGTIIGIVVLVVGIFWVLNNLKAMYKAGKFFKGGIGNAFSVFTGGLDDGKGEKKERPQARGNQSQRLANQIQSALAGSTRAGKGRDRPLIVIVKPGRGKHILSKRRGSSRRASTRGSAKSSGRRATARDSSKGRGSNRRGSARGNGKTRR